MHCNPRRKALKGRLKMQSFPHGASDLLRASTAGFSESLLTEDRLYQAVTVAAILLILASVWIF